MRSPRSAASCSTTSRPSSKRLDRAIERHTVQQTRGSRHTFFLPAQHLRGQPAIGIFAETDITTKATVVSGRIWYGWEMSEGSGEGIRLFPLAMYSSLAVYLAGASLKANGESTDTERSHFISSLFLKHRDCVS